MDFYRVIEETRQQVAKQIQQEVEDRDQLTLGRLIDLLTECEEAGLGDSELVAEVETGWTAPTNPHSYRGFYDHLAFEPGGLPITVRDFKGLCLDALGETFEGYKGGDFVMHKRTPVWLSEWGRSENTALVGLRYGPGSAVVILETLEVEW